MNSRTNTSRSFHVTRRQLILGSKTNARNANVPPLDISFQFPHISAACRWNMRGTRRIARWNGSLMAGEISARLFGRGLPAWLEMSKLDKRAGVPCRKNFQVLEQVPCDRATCFTRVERKRRNSQPAAFYRALVSYSNSLQPGRQQTVRRIDDEWR